MVFSSWIYILFLSLTVLLYWTLPKRFRISLLLVASYVFYMSWSPPHGLIYGPVIFLDSLYFYGLSVAMLKWPQFKKSILIFGVVTELCLLGYFKYANFLVSTTTFLLSRFNVPVPHVEFDIFLPLAISFTNFILISYLVDVYRGEEKPDPSFTRFATYVAFFPHLIAGPVVRAKELLHQFDSDPPFQLTTFVSGIHTFCTGLFIKVFVADVIAVYVNHIYGTPDLQAFNTSWIATYGFAVQIFCDFWGYTMMAQGSALLMGYTLPDNFDAPYFSVNIVDFWRRWHISLSRWLKDYLYIPLGGNRGSKLATYRNLFITMGLGGLWHGASWNFVIWGLYQGMLLSLCRLGQFLKINAFIPKAVALALTFHMVCIGWVFFRAQTLQEALSMLATMINPTLWKDPPPATEALLEHGPSTLSSGSALFIIISFFVMHALIRYIKPRIQSPLLKESAIAIGYCALLYLGVTLGGSQSQQFIYFQF